MGLPLGSTAVPRPCVMFNLIGEKPNFADVLAIPGAKLHWYGKEPKAGRKVGHVTVAATGRGTGSTRGTHGETFDKRCRPRRVSTPNESVGLRLAARLLLFLPLREIRGECLAPRARPGHADRRESVRPQHAVRRPVRRSADSPVVIGVRSAITPAYRNISAANSCQVVAPSFVAWKRPTASRAINPRARSRHPRYADLIVHDLQRFPLTGDFQHRLDEVPALSAGAPHAVQAAGADHEMRNRPARAKSSPASLLTP